MILDKIKQLPLLGNKSRNEDNIQEGNLSERENKNRNEERKGRKELSDEKLLRMYPDTDTIVMPNFIRKGDGPYVYSSYYKIERFPTNVRGFWLEDLYSALPNVVVNIEFIPVDKDIAKEELRKNVASYERAQYIDEERGYQDQKLSDVIEENRILLDSIDRNSLVQVAINIGIHINITDKEEIAKIKKGDEKFAIDKLIKEREKLFDVVRKSNGKLGREVKLVEIAYMQPAGLVASTPVHINQRPTFKPMLSNSLAGLFPFTTEITNDQSGGYIIGFNKVTGEPFAPNVDMLYKSRKVANIHMSIFGIAGKGKSTMINRMITYDMPQYRQVIFDYGRDYGMTATMFKEDSHIKKYSLRSVNDGGFLPDENFFAIPKKDNGELLMTSDEYIGIILINCFDKIYPDLRENVNKASIFQEALAIMYKKDPTGITLTINDLKESLLTLIEYAEIDKKDNIDDYRTVVAGLDACFSGIYKNIFARKGDSIKNTKNLTVIDMSEIKENAQMSSFIMTYNFYLYKEKFGKEKDIYGRKKRIVIDEAHRVTDNKAILGMFSTSFKEMRGEGVQLIISTQTIDDIIGSKEGREILNNSGLTIFFGQSENNLKQIERDLPGKFTERAMSFLANDSVGEAIISLGNKDFICSLINDPFLNIELFKKEVLKKLKYGEDGFFDLIELDRETGHFSKFKNHLKKGYELQEKLRLDKK